VTENPYKALREIQARMAAACARNERDAGEVTLIGASKTVAAPRLREFIAAGLTDVGENYLQEGLAKIELLREENVHWHFIGSLQSNKARAAVQHFELIHSLDRASLAQALNKAAHEAGKVQRVLLQVNVSGESSKSGCAPGDLPQLLELCAALPHLRIEGLMALPAYEVDANVVRPSFVLLRELRDRFVPGGALSMGMSGDYEIAIEEGATFVRVGTALFGARK
jgi:pyridoxal phosphate enzyme (YggS family)